MSLQVVAEETADGGERSFDYDDDDVYQFPSVNFWESERKASGLRHCSIPSLRHLQMVA